MEAAMRCRVVCIEAMEKVLVFIQAVESRTGKMPEGDQLRAAIKLAKGETNVQS